MATVGGILTYICVYGFYIMIALPFFFNPNIFTLLVFVLVMYLFLNFRRSRDDKEKEN
jgi:hypothetical protein